MVEDYVLESDILLRVVALNEEGCNLISSAHQLRHIVYYKGIREFCLDHRIHGIEVLLKKCAPKIFEQRVSLGFVVDHICLLNLG